MKRVRFLAAAGIVAFSAILTAVPALATDVTETYSFTLGNFINGSGTDAPPVTTLTGKFTVTFDPSVSSSNQTTGMDVHSLNVTVGSPIGFTNFGSSPDLLAIGGIQNNVTFISTGTDDVAFWIQFSNPNSPQIPTCSEGFSCGSAPGTTLVGGYTSSAFPSDFWLATTGSVTATVPEPATWAMLLAGLIGAGAMARSARRRAIKAA